MTAKDKAKAFVNELSGAGTYKIVCKASNHDAVGPKKKHVDYLLHIINNPRCQMSVMADYIGERLKDRNWVVVFKTLIVSHNLMTLGHERFIQCMATRSHTFSMDHFADKTNSLSVEMTSYIRKYGKYIISMCNSYKSLAVDVGRMPKGENSPFRKMTPAKVLKAAGVIQTQLDLLLEMELTVGDLTNGVINTAFLMLYKDLVKLYTVYNDCMINLLEKFFEMKKTQCRETIEFYRKFLTRQEGVQAFLQLAEQVGIDKQTHLNLRQVPEDLLPALENHLGEMDALKKSGTSGASPAIKAASEKLAALKVDDQKPESKSPLKIGATSSEAFPSASTDVLEAQRKRFEELKRKASLKNIDQVSLSSQESTNTPQSSSNDLLGLDGSFASPPSKSFDPWASSPASSIPPSQPLAASGNNPFVPVSSTGLATGNGAIPRTDSNSSDPWGPPPTSQQSAYQEVDLFTEIRGSGANFDAVFGSTEIATPPAAHPATSMNQFSMGEILQPQAAGPLASQYPSQISPKLTKDVDSSLANLTVDLGAGGNRVGVTKKTEHQWTPQRESVRTGGNNFQRQVIQARTLAAGQDKGGGNPVDWNKGMYGGYFPQQQQQQQQFPPQPMAQPMMAQPMMAQPMMSQPMMAPYVGQQQPYAMNPNPMMAGQGNPWHQAQPLQQQPNDPFGSIPPQHTPLF